MPTAADNVSATTADGVAVAAAADGGDGVAAAAVAVPADGSHDHPVMSSGPAASRSRTVPCRVPGKRTAGDPV